MYDPIVTVEYMGLQEVAPEPIQVLGVGPTVGVLPARVSDRMMELHDCLQPVLHGRPESRHVDVNATAGVDNLPVPTNAACADRVGILEEKIHGDGELFLRKSMGQP